jgi:hypothetical protein
MPLNVPDEGCNSRAALEGRHLRSSIRVVRGTGRKVAAVLCRTHSVLTFNVSVSFKRNN